MTRGVLLLPLLLCIYFVHNVVSEPDYLNEWAAEIKGGYDRARRVAEDHGYEIVRQLRGFEDHYTLRHSEVPHRSKRSADHHTNRLTSDSRVQWAQQQDVKIRTKRGYLDDTDFLSQRADLDARSSEDRIYRQIQDHLNDPEFGKQWYMIDTRTNTSIPKRDLHVLPLWNRKITGRGIVVTILDDGLEHEHDDLKQNYDREASYDFNDNDYDPSPRLDITNENKHGTRCAGEVAMVANNGICGVGVAFNAKIGGIRMLDGKVTDSLEAESIKYNIHHIDIFSASWGPNDDGRTVEAPGPLARKAFEEGITKGRGGKGVIYVWASGNGGRLMDNCDCDGYTGSIYTISISSASQGFERPWYGERCASTMATTYSSGGPKDMKVVTTDLRNKCTEYHTGTSAAAPLAAGIFALLLESNPSLTWRDVQHLVTWTAQVDPLLHNEGWHKNGAGFWVNSAFGFGLLDATGLVDAASTWTTMPKSYECTVHATKSSHFPISLNSISEGRMEEVEIHTSGCQGQTNQISYLEHVVLSITVDYSRRGDLSLDLVSPSGTSTMLLARREFDKSDVGYQAWGLMSVHNWGESPKGTWKVQFTDKSGNDDNHGAIKDISLTMHGTKIKPAYMAGGPRDYNFNYNEVQNEKVGDQQEPRLQGSSSLNNLKKLAIDLLLKKLQ